MEISTPRTLAAAIAPDHFGAQKNARARALPPPRPVPGLTWPRGSTTAASRTPAATRSAAVRQPLSVVVKMADTLARRRGKAVDIGADGAGLHHAGPVIAAEGDQPFMAPAAITARLATIFHSRWRG